MRGNASEASATVLLSRLERVNQIWSQQALTRTKIAVQSPVIGKRTGLPQSRPPPKEPRAPQFYRQTHDFKTAIT